MQLKAVKKGTFAGPVGADQAEDFAPADRKAYTVEGPNPAETQVNVFDF